MEDLVKWLSVGYRYTLMHMDRVLKPYGLNGSQCMYVIRVCENPGITQDQFLQLFMVNPSNVTRNIVALEKLGFLERQNNARDRRTFRLFPTRRAEEIYPDLCRLRRQWQESLLEGMDPDQQTALLQSLKQAALRAVEQNEEELNHDPD